ncbi:MAG: hypothetical protein U0841_26620 [Chloroflexia bacterium]
MMTPSDDYDGPWKETLEAYLPEIIAFFFPEIPRHRLGAQLPADGQGT